MSDKKDKFIPPHQISYKFLKRACERLNFARQSKFRYGSSKPIC
ncbi:hypothetical protein [Campylobacter concisus]|nr:hypothetical protein [Campylobacter concisus]